MVGAQHERSGVFPLQSLDAASHLAHNLAEATGRPPSLKILLPPNAALMLPCCKAPVDQGKQRQQRQDPGWAQGRKAGGGGEVGSRHQLFLEAFSEQLSRGILPFGLENFVFLVGINIPVESLVLQLFS